MVLAIYSNELKYGLWVNEPEARAAVEKERHRTMTLPELQNYVHGYDRLIDLISRPERKASAKEIQKIEDLRQRAASELNARLEVQHSREQRKPKGFDFGL